MAMFCISVYILFFFFFKQKTAYEIGTGDWSSDVCSSDLLLLVFAYRHVCRMVKQNICSHQRRIGKQPK